METESTMRKKNSSQSFAQNSDENVHAGGISMVMASLMCGMVGSCTTSRRQSEGTTRGILAWKKQVPHRANE